MSRRCLSVFLVLLMALTGRLAAQAPPVAAWQQALAGIEARVKTVAPDDGNARRDVARRLDRLGREVAAWLADHETPLDAPGPAGTTDAALAAALGEVRALVARTESVLAQAPGSAGVFYLGRVDVSVTATADDPAVTTIDEGDLRDRDAKTVTEAVAAAPGVTLHRMGGRNEGMIYVRGFDLRQVPLFVDGVPVYVPYDGYVDLDRFMTDDLAEVRVTKGMTSVLVGPNALGGAINLVTKRPTARLGGLLNAGYGSGSERALDATIGTRQDRWYAQGTASWFAANDFPLAEGFTPNAREDGDTRDNSSHRDGKGSLKVAWTPARGGEYAVSYVGQRGQKGVPSYAGDNPSVRPRFWRWPDWDKDALYFISNTPLAGSQYLRGRAYYDRFYNELQSFDDARYATMTRPSSFRSIYDDYSAGASLEYGTSLGARHTLRAAAHLKEDIHREYDIGEPIRHFDNRTISVGIEDVVTLTPRLTLVAGIGFDRQRTERAENFVDDEIVSFPLGSTGGVNPQAGVFFAVGQGGRVRATLSRKTRLPAIKDRYSYRMGSAIPNPDLAAERSTTAEAGYDGPLGRHASFSVTAFYTAVGDLVQAFYLEPNLFQLRNVGDVRNSGVEAEWRLRPVSAVEASLGYSYLHRDTVGEPEVPLLNTPSHKVYGTVGYAGIPRLRLIATLNHESARDAQDDGGVRLQLDGYTDVSAKAAYTLRRGLDIEASVRNAFDTNYVLYPGFPEPGRTGLVQLRYRF